MPPRFAARVESITLAFEMERSLTADLPAIQIWDVTATAYDWDNTDEHGNPKPEVVGHINIVKGSLLDGSLWDQLDEIEADLELVANSVLDPDNGDLLEEVEDLLPAGTGSQLLILNSVKLTDLWRGYGLGPLLAGEALLALDGDAHCIATYPAPLDSLDEGPERERAVKKLQNTWATLGFKPATEDVWILDPGLVDLQNAVADIRSSFGLG